MIAKLKEIAEIQIGYQVRGQKDNLAHGSYRLIQMRDIGDDGRLDADGLISLDVDAPDRYRVESGDILFQARGSRHLALMLNSVPPDTLVSNHFYVLRVKSGAVSPEYLAWFINQPFAQGHLSGKAQGTTMMLVPKGVLVSLEVALPPLDVQRSIVELADLRQSERALVQDLERKRDALIRALCLKAALAPPTERAK